MLLRKLSIALPVVLLAGSAWANTPAVKESKTKQLAHKVSASSKHAAHATKAKAHKVSAEMKKSHNEHKNKKQTHKKKAIAA